MSSTPTLCASCIYHKREPSKPRLCAHCAGDAQPQRTSIRDSYSCFLALRLHELPMRTPLLARFPQVDSSVNGPYELWNQIAMPLPCQSISHAALALCHTSRQLTETLSKLCTTGMRLPYRLKLFASFWTHNAMLSHGS